MAAQVLSVLYLGLFLCVLLSWLAILLLLVKRKGCCLDYRIDPDRLCATCPKQDNALRLARQTANALAELS